MDVRERPTACWRPTPRGAQTLFPSHPPKQEGDEPVEGGTKGRRYISWPLSHIHVLRGTWASCPMGALTQTRLRY